MRLQILLFHGSHTNTILEIILSGMHMYNVARNWAFTDCLAMKFYITIAWKPPCKVGHVDLILIKLANQRLKSWVKDAKHKVNEFTDIQCKPTFQACFCSRVGLKYFQPYESAEERLQKLLARQR